MSGWTTYWFFFVVWNGLFAFYDANGYGIQPHLYLVIFIVTHLLAAAAGLFIARSSLRKDIQDGNEC